MKINKARGISLIVLVITIIVILILAGAIILSLIKNNPINASDEAKFKNTVENINSQFNMYVYKRLADSSGQFDVSTITGSISKYLPELTNYDSQFSVVSGKLTYIGVNPIEQNYATQCNIQVGTALPYQISNEPGTEASPGTPLSVHSTITGQNPTYNNPVIPAGFSPVNTAAVNWTNLITDYNNGLVIQDASGNQFVWVPVDGTNVPYAKWCTTGMSYTSTTDDTFVGGLTESDQITKYGGFYIGRYESAFDYNSGNLRVAVKKSTNRTAINWSASRNNTYNGYLWNWINYADAKSYSEAMANAYGYNTSLVITNLITGTQWDTAIKWIQNAGFNVTDSKAWGNYLDSISPANVTGYGSIQISGYSDYWRAKNIYDIAGNTWEWSNEKYSTQFINRGGVYIGVGATNPAAYRSSVIGTTSYVYLSFRLALYIK